MPDTLAAGLGAEQEQLIVAVNNMALSQPPLIFADRFLFTRDMVKGGQGIVVYARGCDASMHQFAIKCVLCDRSQIVCIFLVSFAIGSCGLARSWKR
jgi:hypothetical protein